MINKKIGINTIVNKPNNINILINKKIGINAIVNKIKNSNTFKNNTFIRHIRSFLLKEDGGYLLLETGARIYLDKGTEIKNKQKS